MLLLLRAFVCVFLLYDVIKQGFKRSHIVPDIYLSSRSQD
jgi:hypothetical protein